MSSDDGVVRLADRTGEAEHYAPEMLLEDALKMVRDKGSDKFKTGYLLLTEQLEDGSLYVHHVRAGINGMESLGLLHHAANYRSRCIQGGVD